MRDPVLPDGHPPVAHARGGRHDLDRLVDDLRRVAVGGAPERGEMESDLHMSSSMVLGDLRFGNRGRSPVQIVRSYTSARGLVQAAAVGSPPRWPPPGYHPP